MFEEYLECTKYVNFDSPEVKAKADELMEKSKNDILLIKNTYEFVRDEIKHSWDAQDKRVTVTASDMNCSSGTLTIVWTYTVASEPSGGEDGEEPAETGKTATVSKTYDVTFEKQ